MCLHPSYRTSLMRTLLLITMTLFLLHACGDDGVNATSSPFVCTPEVCLKGSCKLTFNFHDNCSTEIDFTEVLLNGALEPETATVGTTFISTGDIPVSTPCVLDTDCLAQMNCKEGVCQAEVWVRAKKWQWGPLNLRCEDPSKDGKMPDLSCKSKELTAGGL